MEYSGKGLICSRFEFNCDFFFGIVELKPRVGTCKPTWLPLNYIPCILLLSFTILRKNFVESLILNLPLLLSSISVSGIFSNDFKVPPFKFLK